MKTALILISLSLLALPTGTLIYSQLITTTVTVVQVVGGGHEMIYYNMTPSHVLKVRLTFSVALGGPESTTITRLSQGTKSVNMDLFVYAGVHNYSVSLPYPFLGSLNITLSNGHNLALNITQVDWVNSSSPG